MSDSSSTHLQELLLARAGEPGQNFKKIAAESGVGYWPLWRFSRSRNYPLTLETADRLHVFLTGKPMMSAGKPTS